MSERYGPSARFQVAILVCLAAIFQFAPSWAMAGTIVDTHGFQIVRRLTGPQGSNSINPTWQVGIGGTDLGFSVNHNGKTYFLFGDTFANDASEGQGTSDWRNNVMAYSTDTTPQNGITFDGWITRANGTARQVITPGNHSVTYIPTGGISVGDKLYAWYMHVVDWSDWSLSHSGLSWWQEGNSQFTTVANYKFQNPAGGDYSWDQGRQGGNFGMVAASYRSPVENVDDDYIYIWGTPGGREGGVKLARVLPSQIEDLSAYRYFYGTSPFGTPLWTASETSGKKLVNSGVGEMSVMYNEAVGAWTMMYISGGAQPDFEIRQAPNPWGPWSEAVTVADFSQAPGLYSPYMNPLYVEDGGRTVYFTMSLWNPYDVYLAKVTLDIEQPPVPGDFNGDGYVDGRDFLVWQQNPAIGNLADWQANYGVELMATAASAVSPVPEPVTAFWAGILATMVFLGRRSPF
jgi:hypothetical protein